MELNLDDRRMRAVTRLSWLVSVGLLGAMVVLAVASAAAGRWVVGAVAAAGDESAAEILRRGRPVAGGMAAASVALLASGALVVAWFREAYRNLGGLGIRRRHREGWAAAAWFVPLVNLLRPKRIAEELWQASSPEAAIGAGLKRHSAGSRPVTLWWAAWLSAALLPLAGLAAHAAAARWEPGLAGWAAVGAAVAVAAGLVLDAAAGLTLLYLVQGVTQRQRQRRDVLAHLEDPPPKWDDAALTAELVALGFPMERKGPRHRA